VEGVEAQDGVFFLLEVGVLHVENEGGEGAGDLDDIRKAGTGGGDGDFADGERD